MLCKFGGIVRSLPLSGMVNHALTGATVPLDPSARRFLDLLAAGAGSGDACPTPVQRRDNLRGLLQMAGGVPPSNVEIANRVVAGSDAPIRVRIYRVSEAHDGDLPTMLFVHGGGFVAGDLDTHDGICRWLCASSGWQIVALEYRLAPEHPFPAALDDATAVLRTITAAPKRWRIDINQFAIGGDSVGANIATVLCQQARGVIPVIAQWLMCPVLDLAGDYPSRQEFASGYYLDAKTLAGDLKNYVAPGIPLDDPRLSPGLVRDLAGLPPTYIHAAEYDPFRDEALVYAEALRASGVTVDHTVHSGMIHLFYGMARLIPHGRIALEQIGAQMKRTGRPVLIHTAEAKRA
jgi:acetyl esterase/lipase